MTLSQVRKETVPAELAGQRIDNYLLRILKGVPRTRIYRLLRRGEVRVNSGRVKPTHRLQAGDEIRIPPVRRIESESVSPSDRVLADLETRILYEDKRLLVMDKPAGLAVHGGSGIAYGVIESLRQLRPDCQLLDLAHRLDRGTSGCLVIAKRRSTLRELHEAFRKGTVEKRYLALVAGHLDGGRHRVDAPLRAQTGKGGERIMVVHPEGQPARTDFIQKESYRGWSLVQAVPRTGRMHQIRAHAAHIDHPIAMDERYGDRNRDQVLRTLGLKRLFLHAESIRFDLDSTGPINLRAPLPVALQTLTEQLNHAG